MSTRLTPYEDMSNRWNIPAWLEREVVGRDVACVYCGTTFVADPVARRSRRSWEHIVNDVRIITRENIALCCLGCNASKGAKLLEVWLESPYCKKRGITKESVSVVIKAALAGSVLSNDAASNLSTEPVLDRTA